MIYVLFSTRHILPYKSLWRELNIEHIMGYNAWVLTKLLQEGVMCNSGKFCPGIFKSTDGVGSFLKIEDSSILLRTMINQTV